MKRKTLNSGKLLREASGIQLSHGKPVSRFLSGIVFALVSFYVVSAFSGQAPNPPGAKSVWASARKEFLGTSATNKSRVYFTGAQGILTEIFYPTLDCVQNVDLQFLVTDTGGTWGAEEKRQKNHTVKLVDNRALAWQVSTVGDNGMWKITKIIFTDPAHNSVIQRTTFESLDAAKTVSAFNLYLLGNPAINNTGGGDNAPQASQAEFRFFGSRHFRKMEKYQESCNGVERLRRHK